MFNFSLIAASKRAIESGPKEHATTYFLSLFKHSLILSITSRLILSINCNNAFYNNDGFDVYNKGISEINADSNWWGSNDNPNLHINVSNWVILTATSTPDFNNTTLNVNFNKLMTAENETIDYNSSIPDREVQKYTGF